MLTHALIFNIKQIKEFLLEDFEILRDNYFYYLLIQSKSDKFTKLTFYPIKNEYVLKISFKSDKGEKILETITQLNLLMNNKFIHTTGLVKKDEFVISEIYYEKSNGRIINFIKKIKNLEDFEIKYNIVELFRY